MATYRDIADSSVEAGAPVSQPLMQALADNQLAIPEGAQGAPRLKAVGVELATSQSQTKDTAVFRSRFVVLGTQSSSAATQSDLRTDEYYLGRGGNFAVHIVTVGEGVSVQARLRKNGSTIQTTSAGTGTVSTWYQLDFAPKDKIDVEFVKPASFVAGQKVDIWIYTNNPFSIGTHTHGYIVSYVLESNVNPNIGYNNASILDTY